MLYFGQGPLDVLKAAITPGHNQAMVDPDVLEWRSKFMESLRHRATPVELIAAIGRQSAGDGRPTKQAIYDWYRTGRVKHENLKMLAEHFGADFEHLRLYGEFVPRKYEPEMNTGRDIIQFQVYQRMARLPLAMKQAILVLVTEISLLAEGSALPDKKKSRRA